MDITRNYFGQMLLRLKQVTVGRIYLPAGGFCNRCYRSTSFGPISQAFQFTKNIPALLAPGRIWRSSSLVSFWKKTTSNASGLVR